MATTPSLWLNEFQVNTTDQTVLYGGTPVQTDARVVGLPDAGFIVVWTDFSRIYDVSGGAILSQRYDALGQAVGGEFNIQAFSETDRGPASVAWDPVGRLIVAYETQFPGNNPTVSLTAIPVLGGTLRSLGLSSTVAKTDPDVVVLAGGNVVMGYTLGSGSNTDIAAVIDTPLFSFSSITIHDDAGILRNVALAALTNGNFVAVFEDQFGTSSTDYDIAFRIMTPAGAGVTAATTVVGAGNIATETDPDVAALAGGGFVTVWTDNNGDGGGSDQGIEGAVYDSAGVFVAGFNANTSTQGNQNEASVTALLDGGFNVVWEDDFANLVRGQRFDAAGNKVGVEYTVRAGVADTNPSIVESPEQAVLSDGRIVMVNTDLSSGDADVVAQIRDPRSGIIVGTLNADVIASRIEGANVDGLAGNDTIHGMQGRDTLAGSAGDDVINGGGGGDLINGATGNDTLAGEGGNDTLIGGSGADTLDGGAGRDTANYASAPVGLVASLANQALNTGDAAGDVYISIENLVGSGFGDTLFGDPNDNILFGLGGDDSLAGGIGNDTLNGTGGNDTLGGSAGNDFLFGGADNDLMFGGNGLDTLDGSSGADTLIGGAGLDRLTGGTGADTFDFNLVAQSPSGANHDVITDFSSAQNDVIDLATIDANTLAGGNQAFTFIGGAAFTGVAGQLRFIAAGGNGFLIGDVNGDSNGDLTIEMTGVTVFGAGDFIA